MKKFVITYGTRLELIKLVPLIYELRKLTSIKTIVVNTLYTIAKPEMNQAIIKRIYF